jgi:hypothetical protein
MLCYSPPQPVPCSTKSSLLAYHVITDWRRASYTALKLHSIALVPRSLLCSSPLPLCAVLISSDTVLPDPERPSSSQLGLGVPSALCLCSILPGRSAFPSFHTVVGRPIALPLLVSVVSAATSAKVRDTEMAEGRGSARAIGAMAFAVACCCCCCCVAIADAATTYYVGDSNGWSFSSPSWPNGKHFRAGDTLGTYVSALLSMLAVCWSLKMAMLFLSCVVWLQCSGTSPGSTTWWPWTRTGTTAARRRRGRGPTRPAPTA